MQLLEGLVAQGGVGGLGQLVGQLLDLGRAGCDRRRWPARRRAAGRAPVERRRGAVPVRLAPAAVVPQHLDRDRLGPGRQHVRLHAAEAVDHQRGDVPVAAVLAQGRAGLPGLAEPAGAERGRDAGPERPVGPRHDPSRPVASRHRPPQQGQRRPAGPSGPRCGTPRRAPPPPRWRARGTASRAPRRPSSRARPWPPWPGGSCRRRRRPGRRRRGRAGRPGRRSSRTRSRAARPHAARRGSPVRSR